MLRIATLVLFVAVLVALAGIASVHSGFASGAPSAIADLFNLVPGDALACTGGCKKP